jgi:hypothetical protein
MWIAHRRGAVSAADECRGAPDMMVYRKGELSPAMIDSGWHYQVALPASVSQGSGYHIVHEFCRDLSLCSRGHTVVHDGEWFNVYCFAKKTDAEKFRQRFGGEAFDPAQRGRGKSWAQWRKEKY